jgi:AcrR family transcriptional regulator
VSAKPQKVRRRYSPEVRRDMILDQTAEIIALDGISNLTMEKIAQNAGVSKALVYNYFDSQSELLKELLSRELKTLRMKQFAAAETANTFEELVRSVTHEYLSYIDKRGLIIEQLQSDPGISGGQDPTQFDRNRSVKYLAPLAAKQFGIPVDLAEAVVDISFGLPASAGAYLLKRERDLKTVEDITVSMILGTVLQVRNDYMTKRPLERDGPNTV